jgi:flagellar basal-body rod protein FlgB
MSSIYLFNVVAQHNRWLSVRQASIAGNIANANTPGFKALDVAPFEMALEQARLTMTSSNNAHMSTTEASLPAVTTERAQPWEVTPSGNNVSLEQELINSGEVNRGFRLNTSVAKAFHRMLLASAKV